jgi:hypothetical protein
MYKVFVTEVLRPMMQTMFPDVENERSDNNPYEHPMTAVGIVLMSAAAIGTIDPTTLAQFTGYSPRLRARAPRFFCPSAAAPHPD